MVHNISILTILLAFKEEEKTLYIELNIWMAYFAGVIANIMKAICVKVFDPRHLSKVLFLIHIVTHTPINIYSS